MIVHWMAPKVNNYCMRAEQTKLKMMMSIGCGHMLVESSVQLKVFLGMTVNMERSE